jgi:hypothetical protein
MRRPNGSANTRRNWKRERLSWSRIEDGPFVAFQILLTSRSKAIQMRLSGALSDGNICHWRTSGASGPGCGPGRTVWHKNHLTRSLMPPSWRGVRAANRDASRHSQ